MKPPRLKRTGPGSSIERKVRSLIALGDQRRAWMYGTMLARLLYELDQVFGKSPRRTRSPRDERKRAAQALVYAIAKANPNWSLSRISEASGVPLASVHRFLKEQNGK